MLRHAFETNPKIRTDILANECRGEWTSTFLRDGKYVVERPDELVYENGVWKAKGGVVRTFEHFPEGELPDDGWGLSYDKLTGFPDKTGHFEEAREIFGDDASYFTANRIGLRAVWCESDWVVDGGPFSVDASWRPDGGLGYVGSRSVIEISA